jgi:hypothetical protein
VPERAWGFKSPLRHYEGPGQDGDRTYRFLSLLPVCYPGDSMNRLGGDWRNVSSSHGREYVCGFCGVTVGPAELFVNSDGRSEIRICTRCNRPTFFEGGEATPGPLAGEVVEHVPAEVSEVYAEARRCIVVGATTGAALLLRKVLMNVAVAQGAEPNMTFAAYVEYLSEKHYLPPGGDAWVGHIRQKGNEATHEIPQISQEDALEILAFAELLLKFIYEYPARVGSRAEESTGD